MLPGIVPVSILDTSTHPQGPPAVISSITHGVAATLDEDPESSQTGRHVRVLASCLPFRRVLSNTAAIVRRTSHAQERVPESSSADGLAMR